MRTVAIAGVGKTGRRHAYTYGKVQDCELIAVVDPNEKSRQEIASMLHLKAYEDTESMLKEIQPDILDICTPTHTHAQIALHAVQHSFTAVFIEAPFARTLSECNKIAVAFADAKIPLYVGHPTRYFPSYATAYAQVKNGAVGQTAVVRTSRSGPAPHSTDDWQRDYTLSGGVTLDLLTSEFDWLRWCFGEVESVFAKGLTAELVEGQPMKMDYTLVTLKFKSGALAHVEGSWADPSGYGMSFEIAGDKGLLEYNFNLPASPVAEIRDESGKRVLLTDENVYAPMINDFLRSLDSGEPPCCTVSDAIEAIKISEAAVESIGTGNPISL
jgi:UDP-N-acetylglucosamine 3-dehydrogenase